MLPTDKVSLLMCVHSPDEAHDVMLEEALDSVLRQSRRPDQVVIVNNASRQETYNVLTKFVQRFTTGPVEIIYKPEKNGLAAAKNLGLKHCIGQWVTYLDADDVLMECKIELQRNYLLQHPEVDLCFTGMWDIVEDGVWRPNCHAIGQYDTHEAIVARLPSENCLGHGTLMARKSVFDAINGYSEDRRYLGREDHSAWITLARAGFKFVKLSERLYGYRLNSGVAR